jgi:hypothetical protein
MQNKIVEYFNVKYTAHQINMDDLKYFKPFIFIKDRNEERKINFNKFNYIVKVENKEAQERVKLFK